MKIVSRVSVLFGLYLLLVGCNAGRQNGISIQDNQIVIYKSGRTYIFQPEFSILYNPENPKMEMRPAGIEGVPYNVITWLAYQGKDADLAKVERSESFVGDGFDDGILDGKADERSSNPFNSGRVISIRATQLESAKDIITLTFDGNELFDFSARVLTDANDYPAIEFTLIPKVEGYFSVGYTGAPSYTIEEVAEIWQPLVWQEKRFPESPVMTLAFRAPIPTAMVHDGVNSIGVLAASEEFPFDPLPVANNSRFGIMVRNEQGLAQPQLFAPVLGGIDSYRKVGEAYKFTALLLVEKGGIHEVFEAVARKIFGFNDYRKNEISSLNQTMEAIIDYSKTDYAWFLDSLKGFAYSTDVPGAVKNVSSLNPLELAIVMDDSVMFEKMAYPTLEYMLSREKFLFSLDPKQRIQHPSRSMTGPIAPVSELTALYDILGPQNRFLVDLAEREYAGARIRNLDVLDQGDTWENAMHLFRATGDEKYLKRAIEGANDYIEKRIDVKQTDFKDPYAPGAFFWNKFVSKWIELTELYELTGDEKYLKAAHDGARRFTMFTWMSPAIPDREIVVNKDGKAPLYWYLKSKGHRQMYFPEEEVPAWRLSEIGLTPESSGTSQGHRAIFMANYAPWMLRLGYYTGDPFLKEVAKAAIIGRYRNFPGYHINTARTTAYEKIDYPLRPHLDLSLNSFHYNHILPMASMLLDYLVTDVFVRSEGKIDFPSEYIEGYAYLQNKLYGSKPGKFFDEEGVQLWMPKGLLTIDNVELNYIAAYKGNKLFLAFTNQSGERVKAKVTINPESVQGSNWKISSKNNERVSKIDDRTFELEVEGDGLAAVTIEGIAISAGFQQRLLAHSQTSSQGYQEIDFGNARAMRIHLGGYEQRIYIYLQDDDSKFSSISLFYEDAQGKEVSLKDSSYPFEFTIPVGNQNNEFNFWFSGTDINGKRIESKRYKL